LSGPTNKFNGFESCNVTGETFRILIDQNCYSKPVNPQRNHYLMQQHDSPNLVQQDQFDLSGQLSSKSGLTALFARPRSVGFVRYLTAAVSLAVGVLVGSSAVADIRTTALDSLVPTEEHRQATAGILQLMQRYHYSRVPVDDELSEQIFDRFLETLDPQKSFLLLSDIEEFEAFRRQFDDAIRHARLNPVFDIFKRFRV